MALFRNDSPGALTLEQAIRKAHWLEELQRRRTAAEAYRRQGRPVPPELKDETPPEDFSKPEEVKRFTNDSPVALTLDQAVERHMAFLEKAKRRIVREREAKAAAKPHTKTARMAVQVAAEGRGNDTEVAHVTPGEMVIPRAFQTPEVLAALANVATAQGIPLERFRVGDTRNRINPRTGAPEFDLSSRDLESVGNAVANDGNSMLSGDPWAGTSSHYDQWTSAPINIDFSGGGPNPEGGAPYLYTGPEMDGITVTGKPWASGTQAMNWATPNEDIIGGTDYRGANRQYGPHNGVDLRNRINQPVFSVVDGTVYEIDKQGKMNFITVRDPSGNLYGYAHTGAVPGLRVNQALRAGQPIGFSDGSGTDQPHTHFTFRPGTPETPATRQSPVADTNRIFEGLGGLRKPTS